MVDLTRLATYFNGKWFFFLGKDIYESTDGQSWDKVTADSSLLMRKIWGIKTNGTFSALMSTNKVYRDINRIRCLTLDLEF